MIRKSRQHGAGSLLSLLVFGGTFAAMLLAVGSYLAAREDGARAIPVAAPEQSHSNSRQEPSLLREMVIPAMARESIVHGRISRKGAVPVEYCSETKAMKRKRISSTATYFTEHSVKGGPVRSNEIITPFQCGMMYNKVYKMAYIR